MNNREQVLVPFVNAPGESDALTYALEAFPEATITLLAVRTPLDEPMMEGGFLSLDETDRSTLPESTAETIDGMEDRQRITVATDEGRPVPTVVDHVAVSEVDRIVISERDRSWFERLLFGRTTAGIVDARTDVPLTVV